MHLCFPIISQSVVLDHGQMWNRMTLVLSCSDFYCHFFFIRQVIFHEQYQFLYTEKSVHCNMLTHIFRSEFFLTRIDCNMQRIWRLYNMILWTVNQFKTLVAFSVSLKKHKVCELWDFCNGVAEDSILQGYDTMSVGNWKQTFGCNIVPSSSRVGRFMYHRIIHSS